jgi:hypothetical protein
MRLLAPGLAKAANSTTGPNKAGESLSAYAAPDQRRSAFSARSRWMRSCRRVIFSSVIRARAGMFAEISGLLGTDPDRWPHCPAHRSIRGTSRGRRRGTQQRWLPSRGGGEPARHSILSPVAHRFDHRHTLDRCTAIPRRSTLGAPMGDWATSPLSFRSPRSLTNAARCT